MSESLFSSFASTSLGVFQMTWNRHGDSPQPTTTTTRARPTSITSTRRTTSTTSSSVSLKMKPVRHLLIRTLTDASRSLLLACLLSRLRPHPQALPPPKQLQQQHQLRRRQFKLLQLVNLLPTSRASRVSLRDSMLSQTLAKLLSKASRLSSSSRRLAQLVTSHIPCSLLASSPSTVTLARRTFGTRHPHLVAPTSAAPSTPSPSDSSPTFSTLVNKRTISCSLLSASISQAYPRRLGSPRVYRRLSQSVAQSASQQPPSPSHARLPALAWRLVPSLASVTRLLKPVGPSHLASPARTLAKRDLP